MAVDFNPSYLSLKISSSLSSFSSERRYVSSTIISDLKVRTYVCECCASIDTYVRTQGKLELVTGATASMMQLQLLDEDGKMICEVDNDSAMLDSYPVKNGYRIHVREESINHHGVICCTVNVLIIELVKNIVLETMYEWLL